MIDLLELQDRNGAWADRTFGPLLKPEGPAHHLKRECDEIIADPYDPMEWADALLLILDGSRRAGIDALTLVGTAYHKHLINTRRRWGLPDENGVVEHLRDEGS